MHNIDWNSIFSPTLSLFEIVMRGTLVYLLLFILLRIFRRNTGSIGVADLLVIVLIADAAQNALGSKYESVTEGAVLVCTILFWNYMLDWLTFKFPFFQRLVEAEPLLLIKDGILLRRNLQKEMITKDELLSQLRENGVEAIVKVKRCYLEGDGKISVVAMEEPKQHGSKSSQSGQS